MDANIPIIEFSDDEIANIRNSLGLDENEVKVNIPIVPQQKRGRRGSNSAAAPVLTEVRDTPLPPAPLTKRDEKEVTSRMQNIMLGGTGILGNIKPYLGMTEEEAQAISEPLSSYLVRNADVLPVAHQILENYDLAAITIGVASYVARIYADRRAEIEEYQSNHSPAANRISAIPRLDEAEPQVRANPFISNATVAGRRD